MAYCICNFCLILKDLKRQWRYVYGISRMSLHSCTNYSLVPDDTHLAYSNYSATAQHIPTATFLVLSRIGMSLTWTHSSFSLDSLRHHLNTAQPDHHHRHHCWPAGNVATQPQCVCLMRSHLLRRRKYKSVHYKQHDSLVLYWLLSTWLHWST